MNTLLKIKFSDPIYSVISNYSASDSRDKITIFENLTKQMSNRVKWYDSIKLLESKNEKNIIEIGPGKILTGLIKRISKNFNCYNISELKDIDVLKNEVRDSDLQALMLAVISEEEEEPIDPKF